VDSLCSTTVAEQTGISLVEIDEAVTIPVAHEPGTLRVTDSHLLIAVGDYVR
jgi:hypothetical protein